MNITVVGIGYVGLSLAVMLSSRHDVIALDVDANKVRLVNQRKSPLRDKGIEEWLQSKALSLRATTNANEAYADPDFIIVAAPTNYDDKTHHFDVSIVDSVLRQIDELCPGKTAVIKSTVPVGYSANAANEHPNINLLFSPEFLRETKALEDNLNPSRIVVGYDEKNPVLREKASIFAELLASCAEKKDVPVLLTGLAEAEAIKLFSNTYLALRVAYFNELDTYAMFHGLDTKEIIDGVCLDPRIQDHYNNPSFGYGGYCLPKDTKQLLHNYEAIPQNLIEAIVKSNATRKQAIADEIERQAKTKAKSPVIGIYRLTMKTGSDNFRQSAIFEVIELLQEKGISLILFEPACDKSPVANVKLVNDLSAFKTQSDLIVANRIDPSLDGCLDKVFTRDLFRRD